MEECPLLKDVATVRQVIDIFSANPQLLHVPQYDFLKEFIEQMGGKVPDVPKFQDSSNWKFEENVESEPESDVELDMSGVINGDTDEPQPMGDSSKVPTEEEMDQASELRGKAAVAFSHQNYIEAISLYTEAIELNPANALFYAKRGQTYLKLNKPNACIRDCDKALELNCDSAAGYKFRGRAHRLLGNWEKAVKDLRQACKLDYDEESDDWLKEVTPNAKLLEEHRIKKDRIKVEKKLSEPQNEPKNPPADEPAENLSIPDMMKLFNNPELLGKVQGLLNKYGQPPFNTPNAPGGGGTPPTAAPTVPPPTAKPPKVPPTAAPKHDYSEDGLD